jgi:hypothetical protein
MTGMTFTKATRKRAKLRLAVAGPSNSGKTTGALEIATGLGGKTALIDTERDSASLYGEDYDFDAMRLDPPYSPERFIEAIHVAEKLGYDVLIIDSSSHEWNGSGGCLEINENSAVAKYRGNTWSAWSETTPRHRAFIDAMLQSSMHIICTMRSKTETVQGDDKKVRKIGMKSEQRDGMEYEFTVMFEIEHSSHLAQATKDRTRMFGGDPFHVTADVGRKLLAWLEGGAVEKISEEELGERLDEINNAQSLDALKSAFASAHKAATRIDDKKALAAIVAAKDMRKEALTVKAPEQEVA